MIKHRKLAVEVSPSKEITYSQYNNISWAPLIKVIEWTGLTIALLVWHPRDARFEIGFPQTPSQVPRRPIFVFFFS